MNARIKKALRHFEEVQNYVDSMGAALNLRRLRADINAGLYELSEGVKELSALEYPEPHNEDMT